MKKQIRNIFVVIGIMMIVSMMGCWEDSSDDSDSPLKQFQCDRYNFKRVGQPGITANMPVYPQTSSGLSSNPYPNIIGGQPASTSEWPWIASLVYQDEEPFEGHHCGGTLIHPNWVLTAAHCVDSGVDVVLGTSSLFAAPGQYERIPVAEMFRYPFYNPKTDEHDIALYRLAFPSQQPTALIDWASRAQPGAMMFVAGWGVLDVFSNQPSPDLMQVALPIISNDQCNQSLAGTDYWVTTNMFCAGYPEGGKDSCQGDSGGPAIVDGFLAGIVSWGLDCAQPGEYGVYARVSDYAGWISEIICDYEYVASIRTDPLP